MYPKRFLVQGVGKNDADYKVTEHDPETRKRIVWICPIYEMWRGMLKRAFNADFHKLWPTYADADVAQPWLTFSVFRKDILAMGWKDGCGFHLDKDLLVRGNKLYSRNTCLLIPMKVNQFINDVKSKKSDLPIGVVRQKKKFDSRIKNLSGQVERLGIFDTPEEAHMAWRMRKLELAKTLASEQENPVVAAALIARYDLAHDKQSGGAE